MKYCILNKRAAIVVMREKALRSYKTKTVHVNKYVNP